MSDFDLKMRSYRAALVYTNAANVLDTFVEDARDEGWSMGDIRTQLTMDGVPTVMIEGAIAGQIAREDRRA